MGARGNAVSFSKTDVILGDSANRAREDRAIARALRILEQRIVRSEHVLGGVSEGAAFFRLRLGGEQREHFEVAFLNTQLQLITVERLFSGTIDGAEVHPRIVAQRALVLNASAVLLAHNHPSGSTQPSVSDRAVTARLKAALDTVEVRLLDHFVVTSHEVVSMASQGMV
ncbi:MULTISPECIES: JAB domain-containing protein [Stenotrophomonas]|uniref:JAB domain-containing protein n=2 Tax=Stenotrophomonas indicatrix TaxID=2045451 RepID=A0ABT8QCR0_9GAMM|nr:MULTISPECIES: JAB domain-containing protein [Stenotrophomonas]MDN8661731.1 JAB domain-containing protein [Stenotrophomonas indicatrix]MDN8668642.1 JAB domain-containing protein [Stenotrophomonas indicatrix]